MFPLIRLQIVIGDKQLLQSWLRTRQVSINSPPNCYWRLPPQIWMGIILNMFPLIRLQIVIGDRRYTCQSQSFTKFPLIRLQIVIGDLDTWKDFSYSRRFH